MLNEEKDQLIGFKVTKEQKKLIQKQADKYWKKSISRYIRSCIDKDLGLIEKKAK